jgi:hypothetical protein
VNRQPVLKLCALRYMRIDGEGLAKCIKMKLTGFSTLMVENCEDRS